MIFGTGKICHQLNLETQKYLKHLNIKYTEASTVI